MKPRFLPLTLIAVAVLAIAGCGGDDEESTSSEATEDAATIEINGEPANDEGSETLGGDSIELEEDDFYFEPTVISGEAGQPVTLEITNEGESEHNITISDQGIDEDTEPGELTTVDAEIPDSGVITFFCSYHEAQNMRGGLAVTGSEPTSSSESSSDEASSSGGY